MKHLNPEYGHVQEVAAAHEMHSKDLMCLLQQPGEVLGYLVIRKMAPGLYVVDQGGSDLALQTVLTRSEPTIDEEIVRCVVEGMSRMLRIPFKAAGRHHHDGILLGEHLALLYDESDSVESITLKAETSRLHDTAPGGPGNEPPTPSTHGEEGTEEGRSEEADGPESSSP